MDVTRHRQPTWIRLTLACAVVAFAAGGASAQAVFDLAVSPVPPAPPVSALPVSALQTSDQPAAAAPVDLKGPTGQEQYGEKPEDYSHEFLRQESVLLREGQWQFDTGINYSVFDHDFTALQVVGGSVTGVLDSRITQRLALVPLDVRYGITNRLQGFASVPFGWSNTETSFAGFDDYVNKGGIGDVNFGVSWLVHKSCGCSADPDIIATFGVTAPTADVSPLQGIINPPNTLLGQGFWFGYWNVTFIHTVDPIILFYGFGSRHGLPTESEGFDITPGAQYFYRAGMGFAVNDRITLSAALTGSYITDPELNGVRIAGLAMEPISLRLATTIARPCHRLIEPFVSLGLTDDAPNAQVGVTFTY